MSIWVAGNQNFSQYEANNTPRHKAFFEVWSQCVKEDDTVILFSPIVNMDREPDPTFWFNWISLQPGKKVYIRSPLERGLRAKELYDVFSTVVPMHKFYAEKVELPTDAGIVPGTVMFSYLPSFIPKRAVDKFFAPLGEELKRSHFFLKKVFNNPRNAFSWHMHGVTGMPKMGRKQMAFEGSGHPVLLEQELIRLVEEQT